MESFARIALALDAHECDEGPELVIVQTGLKQAEVRDALTGQMLCAIAAEAGIVQMAGNAIASTIAYDIGETRRVDIFLHAGMPPPPARMLHSVITHPPADSSIEIG